MEPNAGLDLTTWFEIKSQTLNWLRNPGVPRKFVSGNIFSITLPWVCLLSSPSPGGVELVPLLIYGGGIEGGVELVPVCSASSPTPWEVEVEDANGLRYDFHIYWEAVLYQLSDTGQIAWSLWALFPSCVSRGNNNTIYLLWRLNTGNHFWLSRHTVFRSMWATRRCLKPVHGILTVISLISQII